MVGKAGIINSLLSADVFVLSEFIIRLASHP